MRCLDDKANGLIINYTPGWTDDVRLAWYIASERRDPGPLPSSLEECRCRGRALVSGRFTRTEGSEPPLHVITRAVALAVESYLREKLERAVDDLFIRRGKI